MKDVVRPGAPAMESPEVDPVPARSWRRVQDPSPPERRSRQEATEVDRRSEERRDRLLRVSTTTIDPVADPRTGERVFQSSEEDSLLNASRRGVCLLAGRPPAVGTRLLLQIHLPGEEAPISLIGCARWSRVEYQRGDFGARVSCRVGIELLGGSPKALQRYECQLGGG
ncbi:MAG: hypothetical protein ACE5IL_14720 [Myxococcota bacterium]